MTAADATTYTWDARGNLVGDGTFTYEYNAAGRLVGAESITATLAYTYTSSGLRVGQSLDGEETSYAWDWASGLPEILSEGGNLYLVGQDTLARWDGANWTYHLPDALGSVRQEVAGAGWVTAAREWTPYGMEVEGAQAGLGYTGEWWDTDVGLLYLRARWYSPQDAVFTRRDPVESEPPYQYVRCNPVNWVDPSGYIVNPLGVGDKYFYSCKCGWIDTSHARSKKDLIHAVRTARLSTHEWERIDPSLTQRDVALSDYFWAFASFDVRGRGAMSKNDANEVALGIHMAWENFYEREAQGAHLIVGPVSTFSEEDLVSDLIGFHIGLRQLDEREDEDTAFGHFMRECDVVGYEYYDIDRTTFKDIQFQVYLQYVEENGWFGKHCQWGRRPPGRWSGKITVNVGPVSDSARVIPPIGPTCGTCCYSFSCDKQQEQLPVELVEVTPQSPGKNWRWVSGVLERLAVVGGGKPVLRRTRFDVSGWNEQELNWPLTGQ